MKLSVHFEQSSGQFPIVSRLKTPWLFWWVAHAPHLPRSTNKRLSLWVDPSVSLGISQSHN
jgi:hypothetical protein